MGVSSPGGCELLHGRDWRMPQEGPRSVRLTSCGHTHTDPACTPAANEPWTYLLKAFTQMALVLRVAEFQNVLSQKILHKERSFNNPEPHFLRDVYPSLLDNTVHFWWCLHHQGKQSGRKLPLGVTSELAPGPSHDFFWHAPHRLLTSLRQERSHISMQFYFCLPWSGKL